MKTDEHEQSSDSGPVRCDNTDNPSILQRIINPTLLKLKQEYFTTGCSVIDEFLYGGIPTFGILELTGESASGKTQFCLQIALTAQLPTSLGGLDTEVLYISTERRFPSPRLAELAGYFSATYGDMLADAPMDKVKLEHVTDTETLLQCLQVQLPKLMNEGVGAKVRLVIVDSVAAIFRADYAKDEMKKRTEDLRRVGATLHNLSRDYNAAIVVVNQVSGSFAKDDTGGNTNIPSLGLAWANMVTTRLVLSRTDDARLLSVKFAPHIPNGSLPVQLTAEGFRGVQFRSS